MDVLGWIWLPVAFLGCWLYFCLVCLIIVWFYCYGLVLFVIWVLTFRVKSLFRFVYTGLGDLAFLKFCCGMFWDLVVYYFSCVPYCLNWSHFGFLFVVGLCMLWWFDCGYCWWVVKGSLRVLFVCVRGDG